MNGTYLLVKKGGKLELVVLPTPLSVKKNKLKRETGEWTIVKVFKDYEATVMLGLDYILGSSRVSLCDLFEVNLRKSKVGK